MFFSAGRDRELNTAFAETPHPSSFLPHRLPLLFLFLALLSAQPQRTIEAQTSSCCKARRVTSELEAASSRGGMGKEEGGITKDHLSISFLASIAAEASLQAIKGWW